LTGAPAAGSKAVTWEPCPGTVNGSGQCEVTMGAAKEAKARFDLETHPLSVVRNGTGTVTSSPAGIDCGGTCSANFDHQALVILTGTPSAGSKAVAWDCPGTVNGSGQCEVKMGQAREARATFDAKATYTLTVTRGGTGTGTVTSDIAGIDCGSTCSAGFVE